MGAFQRNLAYVFSIPSNWNGALTNAFPRLIEQLSTLALLDGVPMWEWLYPYTFVRYAPFPTFELPEGDERPSTPPADASAPRDDRTPERKQE